MALGTFTYDRVKHTQCLKAYAPMEIKNRTTRWQENNPARITSMQKPFIIKHFSVFHSENKCSQVISRRTLFTGNCSCYV